MNSILHNSAAMSALQSLTLTQQALNTTQNQVSSGLAVSKASDNAAYWSIAQHLNADNGMVTAANSVMTQSQAILDTANTAIQSVITTINSIQTALTQATNPGADLTNIGTTLASLGKQLTDAISAASFNGTNLLDGGNAAVFGSSSNSNQNTSISFVSGYDANAQKVTTVTMSLPDLDTSSSPPTQAFGVYTSGGGTATSPAVGSGFLGAAQGEAIGGGTPASYDLTQLSLYTSAQYSPTGTLATFDSSGTNSFSNNTSAGIQDMLVAVNSALSNVTNYAAQIGATQTRMSSMTNLNTALVNNYASGVSGLVDADMNTASTRLQALQTQQQLGIQALSIANQNAQLIMKLFG